MASEMRVDFIICQFVHIILKISTLVLSTLDIMKQLTDKETMLGGGSPINIWNFLVHVDCFIKFETIESNFGCLRQKINLTFLLHTNVVGIP